MHSPIYQTNTSGKAPGESVPRGLSEWWAFLVSDLKCLIRKSWSFKCVFVASAEVWSWYVLASSNSENFWALCSAVAILWSARQMTWCTKACQKFVASASSVSRNPVPVIGPLFPLTCHELITYSWPHFPRWEDFYVTVLLSFNSTGLSIRHSPTMKFLCLFWMQYQWFLYTCSACSEVVCKVERRITYFNSLNVKIILTPLFMSKWVWH